MKAFCGASEMQLLGKDQKAMDAFIQDHLGTAGEELQPRKSGVQAEECLHPAGAILRAPKRLFQVRGPPH